MFHLIQLISFLRKSNVKYSFIHSRSDYTQFIVLISKFYHRLSSVWDCRGDSISEIISALAKKNIIYRLFGFFYIIPLFKFIVHFNSGKSKSIIFVSNLLKNNIFKNKHTISNSYVIPCLVNNSLFFFNSELRNSMRNKYKIKPNQSVFIYSGSMVSYQSFDLHKSFYTKILNDPYNLLFILTRDLDLANTFFNQFDNKNIIIKSVDFNRINDYNNLADYAILIRNNDLLNRVASPTKFGEYCFSGLPVIMNKNVHQCYENSKAIGNYINLNKDNLNKFEMKERELISKRSSDYYSRLFFVSTYQVLYQKLIK